MPKDSISAYSNLEAERALLGSVLLDNSSLDLIPEDFSSREFFDSGYQLIFQTMVHLREEQRTIDLVTLGDELSKRDWLDKAGGAACLAGLTEGVPVGASVAVSEYVRIVREKFARRLQLAVGEGLVQDAQEALLVPASEMIAEAEQKIKSVKEQVAKREAKPAKKETEHNPYPTLPEEARYGYSQVYCEAVKECTEANDVFHFADFMSVAGALIGRNVYYKMPRPVYPNLYTMCVGRSGGSRKGSAMGLSHQLLKDVIPWFRPMYSIDSAQGIVKRMKGSQISEQQMEMPLPTLLYLEEFEDAAIKAARKGTMDIWNFLCRAYDGPEWLEDNRATDPIAVQNGLLLIQAGIQEEALDELDQKVILKGIGNRFTYWPGIKKRRKSKTPDPNPQIWNRLVDALREIRDWWQKRGPTRLDWSPDAWTEWDSYYQGLDDMLKENPLIQTLREREHTNLVKIALIHAALDRCDELNLQHFRAARAAAEFQHRAILVLFEHFGASNWVKDEKRIIEIIKGAGLDGINSRIVQRKFPRMSGEHFQRHMRWLTVADGPIRRLEAGGSTYFFTKD